MNNGKVNVAIYARYSSDIQNPSSVDDQIKTCKDTMSRNISANSHILVFADNGISGFSTANRPGILSLIDAVKYKKVEIVVAEGLDRLSRSISDMVNIYELMTYHNVKLFTIQEGYVSLLEASLKGVMNQLFLNDLRIKVRRGQMAKVEKGFFMNSPPYGYKVKDSSHRGRSKAGEREIIPEEAAVVRRIFQEYAEGRKLVHIVEGLNRDGIPSPRGKLWRVGSILETNSGVLRNHIYRGFLTWGKKKNTKNPVTGRVRSVLLPENEWKFYPVPELVIIDEDLWTRVQNRILKIVSHKKKERKEYKYVKRHFTGYVKCGVCGSIKHVGHEFRYICSNGRYRASCTNLRGTRESVISDKLFQSIRAYIRKNENQIHRNIIDIINIKINNKKKIEDKINALLDCVDRGVNIDVMSEKLIEFQKLLMFNDVRKELYEYIEMSPLEISNSLTDLVRNIESEYDLSDVQFMLKCLVNDIVLTPIPRRYSGEKITVNLSGYKTDGWYRFLLAKRDRFL